MSDFNLHPNERPPHEDQDDEIEIPYWVWIVVVGLIIYGLVTW